MMTSAIVFLIETGFHCKAVAYLLTALILKNPVYLCLSNLDQRFL